MSLLVFDDCDLEWWDGINAADEEDNVNEVEDEEVSGAAGSSPSSETAPPLPQNLPNVDRNPPPLLLESFPLAPIAELVAPAAICVGSKLKAFPSELGDGVSQWGLNRNTARRPSTKTLQTSATNRLNTMSSTVAAAPLGSCWGVVLEEAAVLDAAIGGGAVERVVELALLGVGVLEVWLLGMCCRSATMRAPAALRNFWELGSK
jgi:hypothetical protein